MALFNEEKVITTLGAVFPILEKHTKKYWFMGSVVTTALNGSFYRDVHDFDIIVVSQDREALLTELFSIGYKRKPMNFLRVSELMGVYVFSHPTLLDIGFFIIQEEEKCYSISARPLRVEIPFDNLRAKTYSIGPHSFPGIDPSFAYRLSLLHKDNPKRVKELALYKRLAVPPAKWPIYTILCMGLKTNWMIDGFNFLLIIIGKIRVKLGLPYDPWQ
jgi:hypothetical protein